MVVLFVATVGLVVDGVTVDELGAEVVYPLNFPLWFPAVGAVYTLLSVSAVPSFT